MNTSKYEISFYLQTFEIHFPSTHSLCHPVEAKITSIDSKYERDSHFQIKIETLDFQFHDS